MTSLGAQRSRDAEGTETRSSTGLGRLAVQPATGTRPDGKCGRGGGRRPLGRQGPAPGAGRRRGRRDPAEPLPRRHRRVDPPAARPRPSRPSTRTRSATAGPDDLHLRVPQRHRDDDHPAARAEVQGPALGAAVLGRPVRRDAGERVPRAADQPRPGSCARTSSTRTPCTGTGSATSSRSSTGSRAARCRCRRDASSPTSTARATPGRTCSTATSRTWSTSTWA